MADGFHAIKLKTWWEFTRHISNLNKPGQTWLYRGQECDWELRTTLERRLWDWAIRPTRAGKIETALLREFRRRVRGEERSTMERNTLYCLALMQHHGAPTRLLDCTYSPFAAAQFATRKGVRVTTRKGVRTRRPVIWCFNSDWLDKHFKQHFPTYADTDRHKRFGMVFGANPPKNFVCHDNPYLLNERLTVQQGVFLSPGNVNTSFLDNLRNMDGWEQGANVRKLLLTFSQAELVETAKTLKRMNLSSAALFPGLDGFAASLGEQLSFFDDVYAGSSRSPVSWDGPP
jgi:FRG domain-containing protein